MRSSAKADDTVVKGDGTHLLIEESKEANAELWDDHLAPLHQTEPFSGTAFDSCGCGLTEPKWKYEWVQEGTNVDKPRMI